MEDADPLRGDVQGAGRMRATRDRLLELQRLAGDKSTESRSELLSRIGDLFFATADHQSDGDTDVFGSIMERVAFEVEVEARAQLAQRFSAARRVPRNLIRRLANDDISVARPILERSAHLTDAELAEIARSKGQEHLLAISGRERLSAQLTDILVERGNRAVIARVAGNPGARFSSAGFAQLSRHAVEDEQVRAALVGRHDKPDGLLDSIKTAVVARLKSELARSRPDLDATELERIVAERTASIDLNAVQESNEQLARLQGAGQITERMLTDFARARRLPETVRCLALLTGLSDALVSRCLLTAHLSALGVLCKAHGFSNATYAALIQIRTSSKPLRGSVIAAAMRGYDTLPRATAERMLAFLRQQGGP